MIRILPYSETAAEDVFSRVVPEVDVTGTVRDIITTVIREGDSALYEYSRRFDGAELSALEVTREEIEAAMEAVPGELLQVLKLEERQKHLPNQLSGGQQQRVSIGRALMNAPAVVLADEPTGNLDSKNSQEIVELLKLSNKKYNQTLIMITHDENIALQADRIIAIEDGKIIRDEVIR